jgi:inward rectifier potassium channel
VSSRTRTTPDVTVLGAPSAPFRDYHYRFLRASWSLALLAIVVLFLALNAVFAELYLLSGGIRHARPGSFSDAFYFSVQTMGTIGYGDMYPASPAANALVVSEAVVSLIMTALVTGLVFSKFSQVQARVVFTNHIVVSPMNGVEAQLHVVMLRTERTSEGMTFYKMVDLPLVRERSQAFTRSWTAMHSINKDSPLYGMTDEAMAKEELEFVVSLVGTDDTSLQPVHARRHYGYQEVIWGARHADVLTELPDGSLVLDLRKFHDTVPTQATSEFPYGLRN